MDERRIIRVVGSDFDAVAKRRNELMVGKFRLGVQAHRLFLYVLSQVRPEHDENTEYEFAVNELATAIGVDKAQLYRGMIDVLDELATTMVNIQAIDAEGEAVANRFVRVGLIKNRQTVRIGESGRSLLAGAITVSIHKELLPYVQSIRRHYTETELKYVFRLSSSYAQKLYDLLKTHAFKGAEWRIGKEELYRLLAIDAGKFKNFGDFRRYALERAQREISTHTDLDFDIVYIQAGRVVKEIVFRLKRGGGKQIELLPGTPQHNVFRWMVDIGLSAKEAERYLMRWWETDPDRLKYHAHEAKRGKTAGTIRDAVAWFRAGMKTDYRPNKSLFEGLQKKALATRQSYQRQGGLALDAALGEQLKTLYGQVGLEAASQPLPPETKPSREA